MRNRRLHGSASGQPDPGGGPAAAGVPRLRQRGAGRRSTAGGSRCGSGPAGCGCWRRCSSEQPLAGHCGISHTRWATHGPATDRNAHPHLGGRAGRHTVAVVHNGVIENHAVAAARARGRGLRLPEPDRHRGHRPPDRPRAGAARTSRSRRCSGPCRGSRGPTAWRSSARVIPARSSARGSAARWSSASATTSTCWPATRWRSRPTRPGWPICRTARSSG